MDKEQGRQVTCPGSHRAQLTSMCTPHPMTSPHACPAQHTPRGRWAERTVNKDSVAASGWDLLAVRKLCHIAGNASRKHVSEGTRSLGGDSVSSPDC